jgi:hypothetical protein
MISFFFALPFVFNFPIASETHEDAYSKNVRTVESLTNHLEIASKFGSSGSRVIGKPYATKSQWFQRI